jgi:uncharacterized protein YbcI
MADMTQGLSDETPAERRGMQTAELSNAMVAIYKEQFGRGPTKAHTVYATKDLLVCTLENSLTPAEEKMLALDEHQRVREIRMFFQHAAEKEFVETVERISGRRVRGFVSGMDTHQDISTEVFYLEPQAASANDR